MNKKKPSFWLILMMLLLVGCGELPATATAIPRPTAIPTSTAIPSSTAVPTAPARSLQAISSPTTVVRPATPARSFQIAVAGTPTPELIRVTSTPPRPASTTAPVVDSPVPPTNSPLPPTPAPAPFQPTQEQIGLPRCCQAFGFAQDGRLYFYDKPAGATAPATYTLDLASRQRQLLSNRFGFFSADLKLVTVADRAAGTTTIEQVSDGARRAVLQNRASPTLLSPDQTRLAYLLRSPSQVGPEAPQLFSLWTGQVDGSGLRSVWNLREGDNLTWFGDSRHLLLTARDAANSRFGLWVIDTQAAPDQNAVLVVESKGLIAASASPDGAYVTYAITFQGEANSGVWIARADGSERRKFEWQGGWRWSASELFFIPNRLPGETASSLSVYDPATNQVARLTEPNLLPLQIAGDQWEIAPDHKSLVYRGTNNALWLLQFRA